MGGGAGSENLCWKDAVRSAALFAVDPAGIGGIAVRAMPGPARERWLTLLREFLGPELPLRAVPLTVSDDRLLGGLDIPATLQAGRPVAIRGILAEADRGVVLLRMTERIALSTAAHIVAALDLGEVVAERDGMTLRQPARFGIVALDESIATDESPPTALLDRLAFHIDLSEIRLRDIVGPVFSHDLSAARELLPCVAASEEVIRAFCATAMAVGISSLRVPMLSLRAARISAALDGRRFVSELDAALAARLVIAPRVGVLSEPAENPTEDRRRGDDGREEQLAEPAGTETAKNEDRQLPESQTIEEVVLAAARAAIPAGVLAQLQAANGRSPTRGSGRAGTLRSSLHRGRPAGVRQGRLGGGARLNLIETLRAAAPWQRLRSSTARPVAPNPRSIAIRPQDFRIARFKQYTLTVTIFVVDASGSTALNRLAEAKGAIELLLADCYVRRDQVALLAFRGTTAELVPPPTRSLARTKRSLAGLPAGGGTPLASGIEPALVLAEAVQRRGEAPSIVMLTDGRANIARDGSAGRERAEKDALLAARRLRSSAVPTLLCDVSRRSQAQAQRLASEMNARYLRLPDAKASTLSEAISVTASG